MKILVVDDDPAICNMLKMILSARGHEVDTYLDPTATPIVKAQECLGTGEGFHCADAMLIDYFMPNMNGLEFLNLLDERGCGLFNDNKAIITAYGTNELRQKLDQLGVKYFRKPFKLHEITQWLEDCSTRVAQAGGAQN